MSVASLGQRTLVSFVFDVSAGMGSSAGPSSERSALEECCIFVSLRVVEMMLRKLSTIKMSILTYGGTKTRHIVRDHGITDGYEGICEVCPKARPTLETLELLRSLRPEPKGQNPDPLDALIVAISTMLDKQRGESSAAWTRILYLVTRADTRFNVADVDAIKARLQQSSIHLCVIGANFPASPLADTPMKPEASIAWSNVAFWRDLLQALPQASFVTPTQAVHEALAPRVQLVKSSPQNTTLTFGDPSAPNHTLAVPVQILKATAAQRPMGQQKVAKDSAEPSAKDKDHKPETKDALLRDRVDVRRRFYRVDDVVRAGDKLENVDPLPEHSQESFERAYKLGASIVPLSEALEQEIETHQGLEILHFVHADTYRREYSLGEVSYVVADPRSTQAQLQLSSVVRACVHRNVYALCRLVSRHHSDPKLCMLAPYVTEPYDAFYLVRVPFRDDVRRFAFPPLDRITTRTGEELRAHKTIPNAEQQACMDQLVDAMDLTHVADDKNPDGWYTPRQSYNPAIHGVRNAVAWRVLYPERTGLPELHPQLRRYLSTPSSVEERAQEPRRAGMDKFGIQAGSRTHRQGDARKPDEPQKRRRADAAGGDETPDESDTESFATAELSRDPAGVPEQINVTGGYKIRLEDPVSDFDYLVHNTDAVSEACAAMQRVVYALLRSGKPREELYPLLARCLYAYRASAVELDEATEWNGFIRRFKTHVREHISDLWDSALRGREDLGLITAEQDAAGRSSVTDAQAAEFVA